MLKNIHLLRYPHPSSLRRISTYASFLGISDALHLNIFQHPVIVRAQNIWDLAKLEFIPFRGNG
jgi:hypothetical protein